MAQNVASGPQVGQMVLYFNGASMPAIITLVGKAAGNINLTTFPDQQAPGNAVTVRFDPTGTVNPSWRYPDIITGL